MQSKDNCFMPVTLELLGSRRETFYEYLVPGHFQILGDEVHKLDPKIAHNPFLSIFTFRKTGFRGEMFQKHRKLVVAFT